MYHRVFVAGTFDGIHKGHEALLRRAFAEGKNVIVGLTSDRFIQKFKIQNLKFKIKSHEERKKILKQWLREQKKQAVIIPIDDPHEPAASIAELTAIVVSTKTAFRAREINDIRHLRGLSELSILEVPVIGAEDRKPISSTRLRNGEIDRDGRLTMPDNLRPELARPLGRVLADRDIAPSLNAHRSDTMITVGDVATETLIMHDVIPSLAIIDQKVGRKPYDTLKHLPKALLRSSTRVTSGPGYIAREAINSIRIWAKNPISMLLLVDGEEDLLALPAIVHAPIGGVVYYGQPQQGLVEVMVTEEKKREVLALLKQFT